MDIAARPVPSKGRSSWIGLVIARELIAAGVRVRLVKNDGPMAGLIVPLDTETRHQFAY